jgi:hypothetical protein
MGGGKLVSGRHPIGSNGERAGIECLMEDLLRTEGKEPSAERREDIVSEPAPTTPAGQPVGPGRPPAAAQPIAGRRSSGLAVRVVLTLIGAAALIGGAFINWLPGKRNFVGIHLSGKVFFQAAFNHHPVFWKSAGFAMIVLGAVAFVGLIPRSGWLTSLAGAVAVAGFVLFLVEVARGGGPRMADIRLGAWLALGGGVVSMVGGAFGHRRRVEAQYSAVATPAP